MLEDKFVHSVKSSEVFNPRTIQNKSKPPTSVTYLWIHI